MTTKHTELPWNTGGGIIRAETEILRRDNGEHYPGTAHNIASMICHNDNIQEQFANAELIVTAVNAHKQLLQTVKDVVFLENTNMTKKQVRLVIAIAKDTLKAMEGE